VFDIVLTTNYSPWSRYSGGGQKSTHMLACAYAAMGLRVAVVYTKAPWESVPVPSDTPYTVRWAAFVALRPGISSIFRWLNGLFVYREVRKLCDARTTLIGSGDEASLLGFIPHKKQFVYCNRYPNPHAWLTRVPWKRPWGWIYALLREPRYAAMALAIRTAHHIACTSSDSLRQFQAAFPMGAHKACVVPNGIDPRFLSAPLKQSPGMGVLYFGRLTVGKGLRELLQAYNNLNAECQREHPLTLVGQGPLEAEVRAASAQNPFISLLPWMDSPSLAALAIAQRAVVLPSHEESFGNTMLETLALGQDLITCAAGSIPEVVQDQAILVPPADAPALEKALARLLDSPWDPESAATRRAWVRTRYSWATAAHALLEQP